MEDERRIAERILGDAPRSEATLANISERTEQERLRRQARQAFGVVFAGVYLTTFSIGFATNNFFHPAVLATPVVAAVSGVVLSLDPRQERKSLGSALFLGTVAGVFFVAASALLVLLVALGGD